MFRLRFKRQLSVVRNASLYDRAAGIWCAAAGHVRWLLGRGLSDACRCCHRYAGRLSVRFVRHIHQTHRKVDRLAADRARRLDKMASIYAVNDRRVPWMLQMCQTMVDDNIMWMHRQQLLAMQHVLNETRVAQANVRLHIGYYIHLDGLFPDAIADWKESFERTAGELTAIGWKSNNDTVLYHEDSFGEMLEMNRRYLWSGGDCRVNGTTEDVKCSDDRGDQYRSKYAHAWRALVYNAAAELQTTNERLGALLNGYASRVKDVGKVIVNRLRKLNVINEKCFCI